MSPSSWRTTALVRPSLRMSEPAGTKDEVDVSIPYDAAARLAYDEWRKQFGKGSFDPDRYEIFKANYEAITVANVSAKKDARDTGADAPPTLMTLNEYGDCTEEEYVAATSGGGGGAAEAPSSSPQTQSTGDVLGKALEAAQSQSEASSALEDAANALAEEEEVRVPLRDGAVLYCTRGLDQLLGFSVAVCSRTYSHNALVPFPFLFYCAFNVEILCWVHLEARQKAGSGKCRGARDRIGLVGRDRR